MKDLKSNLLRHPQREQLHSEIAQAETMLPHAKPDDKGTILSNIKKAKHTLNTQSPEPLTGKEKDTLFALEKKLIDRIRTNMPTEEVMRKNPAGAVDWHQRWEKANKPLIRMWKNIKLQLNPDNTDKDLANIERYRPSGAQNRLRTDAQIPGSISYGDIPDELWPFESPKNTALAQAKRVSEEDIATEVNQALDNFDGEELDAQAQAEADEEDGRKRPMTPERHALLVQRLADARAIKKKQAEERAQIDDALEAVPVTSTMQAQ